MTSEFNPCEWLPSYLVEELTPQQTIIFEAHLALCDSCREELEELKQVWEGLPYTMELIEPPPELKAEVMNAIFNAPEPERNTKEPERINWSFSSQLNRTKVYHVSLVSAAAFILIIGGILTWNRINEPKRIPAYHDQAEPALLQQEFQLKAYDASNPNSEGRVWMTRQDGQTQVVLRVSGLSETQGDEAYQLWMIKDGNRYNCGTFKVDREGNGILVYPLKYELQFDSIGITLEPDAQGAKPRGKKVLGT